MPKISIVIPAYNVGDYLQECLDSVRNQTFSDIEAIVRTMQAQTMSEKSQHGQPQRIRASESSPTTRIWAHTALVWPV